MEQKPPLYDVMIAIPTRGNVSVQLVPQLIKWAKEGATIIFQTTSLIDCARNDCVRNFLSTDKKYLWFVDADVVPGYKAPHDLIAADKDIVGGYYPLFVGYDDDGSPMITSNAYTGITVTDGEKKGTKRHDMAMVEPMEGLIKVEGIATGMMMIKRSVFDKIQEPWFEFVWHDPQHRSHTGEDYSFCHKATKAGLEVFAHTDVTGRHNKTILL